MDPELVRRESLVEFFQSLVDDALTHQGLRALDLTRYYIVQLLAARTRRDGDAGSRASEEPLALWYARAVESGGSRQRAELRGLADHALFVSGFFSDSLSRSVVDVEYYASFGGYAYQQLSALETDSLAPAFAELGRRFLAFADVLTEVSEQSALTSDRDLLRLYERWIQYGSRRNGERLLRRGITPSSQAVQGRGKVQ
jgi:hypothetical protein